MQAQLNIALQAAREGAKHLGRQADRIDRVRILEEKPGFKLTNVHIEVERTLLHHLEKMQPQHGFQSQISGQSGAADSETQWLIDPLYGSDNFMRTTPGFGVAVACRVRNRLQYAVLIDPILNEEYTASAGGGSHLGGRRLRVGNATDLQDALVALQLQSGDDNAQSGNYVTRLLDTGAAIRSSGCAVRDLLDTAAARLDAGRVWRQDSHAATAAQLILREAGGLTGDESGNPDASGEWLLFSNPRCFRQLLKIRP